MRRETLVNPLLSIKSISILIFFRCSLSSFPISRMRCPILFKLNANTPQAIIVTKTTNARSAVLIGTTSP